MGKREYDRVYQRQHTKVVQIRLHKDNDADIIDDIIAGAKRDGESVSSRLKRLIRIGYSHLIGGMSDYKVVFVVHGIIRIVRTDDAIAADELLELLSGCDGVDNVYINV